MCGEDEGVLVRPGVVADAALEFRQRPGLPAEGAHQPELRFGELVALFLLVWLGKRACAQEADPLAVGRPARVRVGVVSAGELYLLLFRQAAQPEVRHPCSLFFVHPAFDPNRPAAVRGDLELAGRFAQQEVVHRPLGSFLLGRWFLSPGQREDHQRRQETHPLCCLFHGNPRFSGIGHKTTFKPCL